MRARALTVALAVLSAACGGDDDGDGTGNGGSGATLAGSSGSSTGGSSQSGAAGSSGGKTSGGSTSGGSNAGSSGSSAGTSGASGGGSGVRGAISLNILKPDGCALDAQYQDFPKVDSGHPVGESDHGPGIADDETTENYPANVLCSWLANAAADMVITLGPAGKRRSINIGVKLTQGQANNGGLVIQSIDLPAQYKGTCSFTPTKVDQAKHDVAGTFTCSAFDTFDDTDHCAIGPSYFFFQNCTVKQ